LIINKGLFGNIPDLDWFYNFKRGKLIVGDHNLLTSANIFEIGANFAMGFFEKTSNLGTPTVANCTVNILSMISTY
jgi:hypothetical protein